MWLATSALKINLCKLHEAPLPPGGKYETRVLWRRTVVGAMIRRLARWLERNLVPHASQAPHQIATPMSGQDVLKRFSAVHDPRPSHLTA